MTTNNSESAVTTVHTYKPKGNDFAPSLEREPLQGIADCFPAVRFAGSHMTFFYGGRNPGLSYALNQDIDESLVRVMVDAKLQIGLWNRDRANLNNIQETGLLNLSSATADVRDLAYELALSEMSAEHLKKDGYPKQGTAYPHLVQTLLKHDSFKHLVAVAYKVVYPDISRPFQVITVFKPENLLPDTLVAANLPPDYLFVPSQK